MMTRVSVGLPVYNGERYLEQALAALTAQTHTDLEIVISDNASTDRTRQICEDLAASDPRVRYFRQPVNKGLAFNAHFVLTAATAPYFRWYAYDDLLAPSCIELCAKALDDDPDLVLAWPRTVLIDDDGHETGEVSLELPWDPATAETRLRSLLGRPILDSLLLECNPIYGLMRREALLKARPHQSFPCADRALLVEMAALGPWRQVPEATFYNRKHIASSVADKSLAEIAAYFDPKATAPVLMPLSRLFVAYLTGVVRTPGLSPGQRLRCLRVVAAWLLSMRRWALVYHEVKVKTLHVLGLRRIRPDDPHIEVLRRGLWH